jgi:hypothetical protein
MLKKRFPGSSKGIDTHEKMYRTDPPIRQWWKYPASNSFPAGNPIAKTKKTWTDPIQLMVEGVSSLNEIRCGSQHDRKGMGGEILTV